jgi:hypothetical protein
MNRLLTILLLLGATAHGQINNPVTASSLGLGTTDAVAFQSLVADQLQVLIGTNLYVNLAEDVSEFFVPLQLEDELTVVGAATFSTNVTVNGNATLNGVGNIAPAQTADSADSLMTRELSDDRYSFSRWYDANNLLSGAQNVGVNPLATGNASGSIVNATLVTVSNVNTKFMLPVDYRLSGEVKVVSYWTDRGLTNGGANGDIAVWTFPFVVQPTTDTTTNGDVSGTTIKNTFTANYGGSGDSRYYVMEQTLNFATVTGISATNPMQLKWVEFQRRAADASDTSNDNIFLSGVHIYVP